MSRKDRFKNREFQDLAAKINATIIENEGLIGDQKEQVELVYNLEKKFKHFIQNYKTTLDVYEKFIKQITEVNGNILSARPYFREKSETFGYKITKAIKENDIKELMKFDINFQLIDFIAKNWGGPLPERPGRYYREFLEARRILIENNLPLAINRAKLFYKKTPRSHLTVLDFIDICTYGLISGVDKYVGEYTKVWRSVCIGRMVGYMIEEYSKTFLRMYPVDKKILYRANALKYRMKIENIEDLTQVVNESFENDKVDGKKIPKLPITEVHIRTLLNSCHYISTDSDNGEDGDDNADGLSLYDYTPDPNENVESKVSKKELMTKVIGMSKDLEIIERKVIKLKGVEI